MEPVLETEMKMTPNLRGGELMQSACKEASCEMRWVCFKGSKRIGGSIVEFRYMKNFSETPMRGLKTE